MEVAMKKLINLTKALLISSMSIFAPVLPQPHQALVLLGQLSASAHLTANAWGAFRAGLITEVEPDPANLLMLQARCRALSEWINAWNATPYRLYRRPIVDITQPVTDEKRILEWCRKNLVRFAQERNWPGVRNIEELHARINNGEIRGIERMGADGEDFDGTPHTQQQAPENLFQLIEQYANGRLESAEEFRAHFDKLDLPNRFGPQVW